jgi:hypothetical protein
MKLCICSTVGTQIEMFEHRVLRNIFRPTSEVATGCRKMQYEGIYNFVLFTTHYQDASALLTIQVFLDCLTLTTKTLPKHCKLLARQNSTTKYHIHPNARQEFAPYMRYQISMTSCWQYSYLP